MQRMMDVNYMGTFYGARAALPIFRAQRPRTSDHRVVDRRPARHPAHGRLQRDQGGAGRASPSRCARSSPAPAFTSASSIPVSTETEFRRGDGARLRPLRLRPRPEAVGRRRGRGDRRVHRAAAARGVSARTSRARWRSLNAVAPGFTDRLVQKYGRRREGRPNARPCTERAREFRSCDARSPRPCATPAAAR